MKSKVFGIGLSRTGTSSLTVALQHLGLRSIHFPADAATQAELIALYANRAVAVKLSILDQCDALTDTPVVSIYRELSELYSDSRFILTVRDLNAWLPACEAFWLRSMQPLYRQYSGSAFTQYVGIVNQEVYGSPEFDRNLFQAAYESHVAGVLSWFANSPERLLVLDICAGQGWPELCAFLRCPVPPFTFPHTNASRSLDFKLIKTRR